ncbi:hypothetical protein Mettu_0739 [Methylobacter tundripaludum SV96]|uniref:Uncharacterized protein n=1 Tax=Methylobacter tundripaludum (strain ATCC BAA-1195 / DSM 17260 / SV96) TaxID=697282 RepID=G3IWK6_METTV|nr:hypothetical protein Mettu_0739 [Methylobacter tundripaludum SV96]
MRSTKPAPQPLDLSESLEQPGRLNRSLCPFDYAQDKDLVEACHELVEWGGTVKLIMVRQANHERLNLALNAESLRCHRAT